MQSCYLTVEKLIIPTEERNSEPVDSFLKAI